MLRDSALSALGTLRRAEANAIIFVLGDFCMTDQLSPAFHAEIILELFNEFGCFRKVSERTGILLSSYPPEHLEAVSRHLPKELVQILPRRQLRAA
jgi:hypothetical protein